MKNKLAKLAALVVVASTVGCGAGPRYVAASTASKGQIKFLHVSNGGNDQGIVKCDMGEDGTLSGCRDVAIVLEEK